MANNRSFWNFTVFIAFLIFFGACVYVIDRADGFVIIAGFSAFDLLLVSLATFRLVHLLTYDKIFDFVRHFFQIESHEGAAKPVRIASRVVYEMLECIWCTGIWSGLLAVTIYTLGLWGQFVIIVLAAAGIGSLLQIIARAIAKE